MLKKLPDHFKYRVFQKSVPEPSSWFAAKYSKLSIYQKVAAKAVSPVYVSNEFTQKISYYILIYKQYKYICYIYYAIQICVPNI